MAIKKFLAEYGNDDDLRPFDRVRHLLGIVESGKKDLGSAHRKYLVEKLKGES
ncbi:MAG: hypothetical protein JRH08_13400 [Deltaproteobacteria bacterium]|nr:hypothetical protein [Deltaproteobacteria bacterium]MBW2027217.1 hypothetical protein [Deltaproteobacteria bacterium]MBW2126648.1 hypothetical protein [Deltaproteobacteria bacterium]